MGGGTGLLGFTRHAAYELALDRIRVNAVCPGPTATGSGGGQIPSAERKAERARKILCVLKIEFGSIDGEDRRATVLM